MAAGKFDITIEQGASFGLTLTYEEPLGSPKDLTGYGISAAVRAKPSDSAALLTFAISSVAISAGKFQVYATPTATAALSLADPPARTTGYWDVFIQASGATATATKTRILEGDVALIPRSTH